MSAPTTDMTDTAVDTTETAAETTGATAGTAETFSADYVRQLRDEAAKLRVRAQHTDELRARLHTELVRATGKLADPNDFPYSPEDADLLDDPEALNAAIDALLAEKPHLRSRTPRGDIGQGKRGTADNPVNFLDILKMAQRSG